MPGIEVFSAREREQHDKRKRKFSPGIGLCKRFADSLSVIDCNLLQSSRFWDLMAVF